MGRDVLDIAKEMDQQGIEWQVAVQCAPLITGLKVSNLMMLPAACEDALRELFAGTDISCAELRKTEHKVTLLVYRDDALKEFLSAAGSRQILLETGYQGQCLEEILRELKDRYENCRNGQCVFPHEMGLFLGYPEEDVRGFMKWHGQHFLCAGYWKVYADAEMKRKLFAAYDRACDTLIRLIHSGRNLKDIISLYRNRRERFAVNAA